MVTKLSILHNNECFRSTHLDSGGYLLVDYIIQLRSTFPSNTEKHSKSKPYNLRNYISTHVYKLKIEG